MEGTGVATLEVVVPKTHTGGPMLMVGHTNHDPVQTLAARNTLEDPAALFRGAQLAGHPNGPRKGGLKKACT